MGIGRGVAMALGEESMIRQSLETDRYIHVGRTEDGSGLGSAVRKTEGKLGCDGAQCSVTCLTQSMDGQTGRGQLLPIANDRSCYSQLH